MIWTMFRSRLRLLPRNSPMGGEAESKGAHAGAEVIKLGLLRPIIFYDPCHHTM